jgi:hypothetical protein
MSKKKYTGWAMDVYPDMSEKDIAHHVRRQLREGANFVWIGHNNPGEVDRNKVEPALSYAVYEAYVNSRDPRHEDARELVDAQTRMLDFCLKKNVPVVFPIGYQIQMGEVWNRNHPEHLRRTFEGRIINAGGVSACFYSPQYRRDITKYYRWIVERFIDKYHPVILMVNLADEPFGGDYSQCAEAVFRRRHGRKFVEAAQGDVEEQALLGEFQSNYIAEYASWSADAWHAVCSSIPSTMSFCGYHGREENVMPSVQALFELTPDHFHPTFDVYPRDGSAKRQIKQSDITMLIILLKQLSYLSHKYQRPYWLWTTGNSWGLGQNSPDKANIADALANQFYAASTAVDNRGNLKGIAVWNYNIPNQGLYNDPNPIIYDPDEMFRKVTRILKWLRARLNAPSKRAIDVALVLSRSYGDRCIGRSRKWVRVRPFGFEHMKSLAKRDLRIVADESCAELFAYLERTGEQMPKILFYLSDGAEKPPETVKSLLMNYALKGGKIVLPARLARDMKLEKLLGSRFAEAVFRYTPKPDKIKPQFYEDMVSVVGPERANLYPFSMGKILMVYNITHRREAVNGYLNQKPQSCYVLSPSASPRSSVRARRGSRKEIRIGHHEVCFVASDSEATIASLIRSLKES